MHDLLRPCLKARDGNFEGSQKCMTLFTFCLCQILKVNTTNGNYTVVAGNTSSSITTDGILATKAKLNNPTFMARDPVNGTLYFTEYGEPAAVPTSEQGGSHACCLPACLPAASWLAAASWQPAGCLQLLRPS